MKYAAYDPMTDSIDTVGSLPTVIPALCSDAGLELIAIDETGLRDLRPEEEQAAKVALAAYAEATGVFPAYAGMNRRCSRTRTRARRVGRRGFVAL